MHMVEPFPEAYLFLCCYPYSCLRAQNYKKLVMAQHIETGKKGEQLAAIWLQQQGYTILHSNWRYLQFELDVIATRDNILHFIEVKTRTSLDFGMPEEGVTRLKIRHLIRAGAAYQYQYPGWKRVQYNILSILLIDQQEAEYFFIEDVYV